MKRIFIGLMMMFITFGLFAADYGANIQKDNMDSSLVYLVGYTTGESNSDAFIQYIIGVGDGNKGTLSVIVSEGWKLYGSDFVRVNYKFDDGTISQVMAECVNTGLSISFRQNDVMTFFNGMRSSTYLHIRIFDYANSPIDYTFNLSNVKKALKAKGMNI